jgi:acyl carrier protein
MENYKDQIRTLIAQIGEIELDEIGDETHLSKDLGFDSLRALELMTVLEEKFNLRIPDEQLIRFTSVNSLSDLVAELREGVVVSGAD